MRCCKKWWTEAPRAANLRSLVADGAYHPSGESASDGAAENERPRGLREQLAELEHEQWCNWSRALAESETLTPARLAEWSNMWVPYSQLSESEKERDRKYADLVLSLLRRAGALRDDA